VSPTEDTTTTLTLTGAAGQVYLLSYFAPLQARVSATAGGIMKMKLRRTNNTAADVTNTNHQAATAVVVNVDHYANCSMQAIYTTAGVNDIVSAFGERVSGSTWTTAKIGVSRRFDAVRLS